MDNPTDEQIGYLIDFIGELHRKLPHSGDDGNEFFIDDIKTKGVGSYKFYLLGYYGVSGGIYVHDNKAGIFLDVTTRTTIDAEETLDKIAQQTGMMVISDDTWDEGRRYLVSNRIDMFVEEKPNLTVNDLLNDHVSRASEAAAAVNKLPKEYLIDS